MRPHDIPRVLEVLNALSTEQTLALIARVDLSDALLVTKLNHDALSQALGIALDHLDHDYLTFIQPVAFRRRSNGIKLVWADYKTEPNHALIRAIAQAHSWVDKIKAGQGISDITKSEGISEGRVWKRIRLAFLSPKLVAAILDGTTGQELTIKKLSVKDIPRDWDAQHAEFIGKRP